MSDVALGFFIGAVSASSLVLGALVARIWRGAPSILAGLMALGAGALLAAVTLDIIDPVIEDGHLLALMGGAIGGGVLFTVLNREINSRGGFLRKASTSIDYLRQLERRRRRAFLRDLERSDLLRDLPRTELEVVADLFTEVEHDGGDRIYRVGDPANHIRVVVDGTVEVIDPDVGVETVGPGGMFGHQSFAADGPHSTTAVAAGEVRVLRLDRADLDPALDELPVLASRLQRAEEGSASRVAPLFPEEVRRLDVFADLDPGERRALESVVFWKDHPPGHVFFHRHEAADRFYFLGRGSVRLVTGDPRQPGEVLRPGAGFGGLAFLVGGTHTATAVADGPVGVWVLRRRDFEHLVEEHPSFGARLEAFLESGEARRYLTERQDLDPDVARDWEIRSRRRLGGGGFPLDLRDVLRHGVHGAPLAIWLGILLDGIPESFVLGKGVVDGATSLALVGGIFISNFPEALSSSVGMAKQGISSGRILVLWGVVVLVTAAGAAIGTVVLDGIDAEVVAAIEGLAAGAMLTMIAETMLPEAVTAGGRYTGLWALAGFLVAAGLGQLG